MYKKTMKLFRLNESWRPLPATVREDPACLDSCDRLGQWNPVTMVTRRNYPDRVWQVTLSSQLVKMSMKCLSKIFFYQFGVKQHDRANKAVFSCFDDRTLIAMVIHAVWVAFGYDVCPQDKTAAFFFFVKGSRFHFLKAAAVCWTCFKTRRCSIRPEKIAGDMFQPGTTLTLLRV